MCAIAGEGRTSKWLSLALAALEALALAECPSQFPFSKVFQFRLPCLQQVLTTRFSQALHKTSCTYSTALQTGPSLDVVIKLHLVGTMHHLAAYTQLGALREISLWVPCTSRREISSKINGPARGPEPFLETVCPMQLVPACTHHRTFASDLACFVPEHVGTPC